MTQLSESTQREALPTTMQAVICHGPEDYRLEEVPVPTPGPGEALVRVEAVGICASDLKCYHGAAKFWGDENRPAWAETEVIPGHEFVGDGRRARRRGAAAAGASRSATAWSASRSCRAGSAATACDGKYWMCGPHDMFGFKRRTPGAHGGVHGLSAPTRWCTRFSQDLPPAHAAFAEPLSCALHAVERATITFDDVVVVAGCGPIGLGMIAGAKAKYPGLGRRARHGAGQAGPGPAVRRRPGRSTSPRRTRSPGSRS